MKPQVLQQANFSGGHPGHRLDHRRPDAIPQRSHRTPQQYGQPVAHRRQSQPVVNLPPRTAQMRAQYHPAVPRQQVLNRRQSRPQPLVVIADGLNPLLNGNIEVHPRQRRLAGHIQLGEGSLVQASLAG